VAEAVTPDLVIFVMDGSIGQAAFDQAKAFKESVEVRRLPARLTGAVGCCRGLQPGAAGRWGRQPAQAPLLLPGDSWARSAGARSGLPARGCSCGARPS
jgi:hypothetical protein